MWSEPTNLSRYSLEKLEVRGRAEKDTTIDGNTIIKRKILFRKRKFNREPKYR